jgi:hypothetical protein
MLALFMLLKSGILLKKLEENGVNMRVLLALMCSM